MRSSDPLALGIGDHRLLLGLRLGELLAQDLVVLLQLHARRQARELRLHRGDADVRLLLAHVAIHRLQADKLLVGAHLLALAHQHRRYPGGERRV